ncbi:VOC family protein [Paracoccus kondratievae]|uniref:Bleomycin resistance protein n=1 Tax=Paracoccus kondratievae TaxID=135740 RepID=A0AAD3RSQ7_9RHOB|nr:VOC family protein [Paracoccus kondratievae]GLK63137.1 bleomycin resistance protein [Paracoccus kondratievae]
MYHGKPCWFELSTAKGALAEAGAFYGKILGWTTADAGMEGFTYHLASHGGDMVAGLMETPEDCADVPPSWMIYFDVDDADAAVAKIRNLGGSALREPEDIPHTGRFAVVADPQGAVFGILQPLPMDPQPPVEDGAWNQRKEAHGNWVELMSTDPVAGFGFYSELFGWTKSTAMDMGEMGTYQLFSWQGAEIGGMMGLGNSPVPCWLPYFGVNGVAAALDRIRDGGGEVVHGPIEVPGPAFIAVARDPQGVYFALVGPKEVAS